MCVCEREREREREAERQTDRANQVRNGLLNHGLNGLDLGGKDLEAHLHPPHPLAYWRGMVQVAGGSQGERRQERGAGERSSVKGVSPAARRVWRGRGAWGAHCR